MGDVIAGRYELLDPIASGASGSVWRAVDHRSGRLCAAKVMRQRDSADMLRFVREKSIRVDHPHLLTPHGFGAEDDHVVIGMPLASGGTLQDLLSARGALSEPLCALLLAQLLSGLARLHEEGWVHRDVKPGNLLFEPVGRGLPLMRLADFGIAVHESDVRLTATGFVNGTPGYVAPEIMSSGRISHAQDLWAAGVVGVLMLSPGIRVDRTGAEGPDVRSVLASTTPALAGVLRSLLSVDPDLRCPDPAAAIAALQALAQRAPFPPYPDRAGALIEFPDRLPPLPQPAPSPEPAPSPAPAPVRTAELPVHRRRRRLMVGIGVACLVVSAALGTVAVRGGIIGPVPTQLAQRDANIVAGGACDWTAEGTEATSASGAAVVCVQQDAGTYRWERSGR